MKNPLKLWKDIVYRFAEQSRCKSRQVGAILVLDNHQIGEGWNSAPPGSETKDCKRQKCIDKSCKTTGLDLDQAICTHAEANLIGIAAKFGNATGGSVMYCTTKPCAECSKLLIVAGIIEVVYFEDYPSPITDYLLKNANVKLTFYKDYYGEE